MTKGAEYTVFWFRRDLRLNDNSALYYALKHNKQVLPVFIFDKNILSKLRSDDLRVLFIYETVQKLRQQLRELKSDIYIGYGDPVEFYQQLMLKIKIKAIYCNHDYEPYARKRDELIELSCRKKGVDFKSFKDHVIFEKSEIQTEQQKMYTVYTPYKNKWLSSLSEFYLKPYPTDLYWHNLAQIKHNDNFFTLTQLGFNDVDLHNSQFEFPSIEISKKMLKEYSDKRDYPYLDKATSLMGLHLRFGTVSIRKLAETGKQHSAVWLSELVWRDFFTQVLWHHPIVEKRSFKPQYEKIKWRDCDEDFERWKNGETGYPLVDAGMRELNATGHMHNRVRMVVASFLTKHLLQHWYRGERYFADRLLDYDLAANNGNWQWAAGTGCDAAPYFRVFNPQTQLEKFDPQLIYTKKWVPEYGTAKYVKPMIEHSFARQRALSEFKKGLA